MISDPKKIRESIRSFEQAITINPTDREAWYNRAKGYQQFGVLNESIRSFENMLRTDRKEHDDELYEEIITLCDTLLAEKSQSLMAMRTKSSALIKLGRYDETFELIDTILNYRSNDFSALTLASFVLYLSGEEIETSISYVNKALMIKEDYAFGWYIKGIILHNAMYYPDAVECFNIALASNSKYIDPIEMRIESIKTMREKRIVLEDDETELESISILGEEELF